MFQRLGAIALSVLLVVGSVSAFDPPKGGAPTGRGGASRLF